MTLQLMQLLHVIGDTMTGSLLINSTNELQLGDTATAIWDDGSDLNFKDSNNAAKTLSSLVASGSAGDASTSNKGITKLSVAPVSAAAPIAVGDNDPRVEQYFAAGAGSDTYTGTMTSTISAYDTGWNLLNESRRSQYWNSKCQY